MEDESGFTLIEVLVVMVIIGVLLVIAVPAFLGFRDKAEKSAGAADVREAVPSAEAYYLDNNQSYAGISIAALKSYDPGLSSAVLSASGGPTKYCLSANVGRWYAHVVGPGGLVVPDDSSDFCSSWLPS
jgi:type IV pilus assembly protein PilA